MKKEIKIPLKVLLIGDKSTTVQHGTWSKTILHTSRKTNNGEQI